MAEAQTLKKVCKGKKPSAESPNNYCRCCKAALRILYGSSWKSFLTENLFRPSGKKGIEGEILSHQLKKIGIIIEKSPSLSERLCKPCAAKIRETCEGFSFIRDTINVPNPKLQFVTARKEVKKSQVMMSRKPWELKRASRNSRKLSHGQVPMIWPRKMKMFFSSRIWL